MDWYRQPAYAQYWADYNQCMKWMAKHNQLLTPHQAQTQQPSNLIEQDREGEHAAYERGASTSAEPAVDDNFISEQEHEEDVEDEEYVDEQMIDFFAVTLLHRQKRDEQRLADAAAADAKGGWLADSYKRADQLGVGQGAETSTLTPNMAGEEAERAARAEHMYGADRAGRVRALEIRADIKFNHIKQTQHTPLWPNIPLKL